MRKVSSISNDHDVKSSSLVNKKKQADPFFKQVLQPKLHINQPNDKYEQQADDVAGRLMASPPSPQSMFFKPGNFTQVSRKCSPPSKEEQKNELIQRKENSAETPSVNNELESYVSTLSNSGSPLSKPVKSFFEARTGNDFSNVRVHTNDKANKSAATINALAYTNNNNIVFGSNQYHPETESGKRLLAHELTHVVQQQKDNSSNIQRQTPASTTQNKFSECSPAQQQEINNAIALARQWINYAESEINGYMSGNRTNAQLIEKVITANFQTLPLFVLLNNIQTIGANFSTLKQYINGPLKYYCKADCEENELGRTPTYFAYYFDRYTVLCQHWFVCGTSISKATTIVHEAAHKYLGAVDNAYEYWRSYNFLQPADAIINADSYAVAARQLFYKGANGPGQKCTL
ncbi:MAG: hypothetical protein JWQ09_3916 [Segetibacter sp.]|nr:hypothetical protein [Segetibacter sp.]